MERTATSTIRIRGARQRLTLRGPNEPRRGSQLQELSIIHDGSLLIQDGVLVEVGATRRVENLAARAAIEVSAAGRVAMPGFVDSHSHICYSRRRALSERRQMAQGSAPLPECGWKHARVCFWRPWHGMATTTVEVKTGCGPDPAAGNENLACSSRLETRTRGCDRGASGWRFRKPSRFAPTERNRSGS